jgi:hypothetical protein
MYILFFFQNLPDSSPFFFPSPPLFTVRLFWYSWFSPQPSGVTPLYWEFNLGFVWVVVAAVGWVGVWRFWAGPGLVWMGCGVFAVVLLCGGRLLEAGHQSSREVSHCW